MAEQERGEPVAGADEDDLHEYDGIQEYDNPLPRWWVWIFWGTFYFSLAYVFFYWFTPHGKGVVESYEIEAREHARVAAERALKEAPTEESLRLVMADPASTEAGQKLYTEKCAVCHGEQGQGVIGPNLTDDAWLHGTGSLMDLYTVVAEGAVQKGMPAWSKQLAPDELRRVVAFVGTLRGKRLPGRAPEGASAPP